MGIVWQSAGPWLRLRGNKARPSRREWRASLTCINRVDSVTKRNLRHLVLVANNDQIVFTDTEVTMRTSTIAMLSAELKL